MHHPAVGVEDGFVHRFWEGRIREATGTGQRQRLSRQSTPVPVRTIFGPDREDRAVNTVVRARIDEKTRDEAMAVLGEIGLTASDAFRLMMVRIAAEKRLPFDPLAPNAETVEAMKAARRNELVAIGGVDALMTDLNADD